MAGIFNMFKKKKDNSVVDSAKKLIDSQTISAKNNGHKAELPPPSKEEVKCKVEEAPVQEKAKKGKKSGNNHNDENAFKDMMPNEASMMNNTGEKISDAEKKQIIEIEEKELEQKIPGNGYLFNIKKKFLPESTILDKGQVLTFALGFMQEDMLDPTRTESLFDRFAHRVMRMNISVEGVSRQQVLMARQQEADKNAAISLRGDLVGRPPL